MPRRPHRKSIWRIPRMGGYLYSDALADVLKQKVRPLTNIMRPVKSSNIDAIGYDPAARDLTVRFKTGAIHRYHDVPPEKHAALMKADSVGAHFHANIRNAHKSTKVEDE